MYRTITHATTQIAHHVGALAFVKGVEVLSHDFFERFGTNIRNWPTIVLFTLAVILYLAGLATAKAIGRRWFRKTVPPDLERPPGAAPDPIKAARRPEPDAKSPTASNRTKEPTIKVALAACAVLAVVTAGFFTRR